MFNILIVEGSFDAQHINNRRHSQLLIGLMDYNDFLLVSGLDT